MKYVPFLFDDRSVRGILSGYKTQTRRLVKRQLRHPSHGFAPCWGKSPDGFAFGTPGLFTECGADYPDGPEDEFRAACAPGDIIWGRECWNEDEIFAGPDHSRREFRYRATDEDEDITLKWRPSIFMPRSACRLYLLCTDVRVERLHDLTHADALAEGMNDLDYQTWREEMSSIAPPGESYFPTPVERFMHRWDGINFKTAPSSSNPWLFAYTFERLSNPPD